MSRIDDLIRELCPDGVEFPALGDVVSSLRTGLNPRQNFSLNSSDAKNFYITVRELGGFDLQVSDKTDRVDDSGLALIQNRSKLQKGDILFSATGTIGRTALVQGAPNDWNIKEGIYALTPKATDIDSRFLIYLLHSERVRSQILAQADGSTVASIPMSTLRRVRIPVPPMGVQREIVRVLDLFESLEAELEAELEARRRQYEHHRDSLLTFPDGDSVWLTLGEIAKFTYGLTAVAQDQGDLRFVRITDIDQFGKLRKESPKYIESSPEAARFLLHSGDLLVARTGASYGKTVLIAAGDDNSVYASFLIRISVDRSSVDPGYYWHFAQSGAYWSQAESLASVGGQPQFNANALSRIRIPVPSLEEQERIVAILDKFDALVNDLSIGLPAELAARRKQYEYYRDRLLTFPERAA